MGAEQSNEREALLTESARCGLHRGTPARDGLFATTENHPRSN